MAQISLMLLLLLLGCASAQTCVRYEDFMSVCFIHIPQGASVFLPASYTLDNLTEIANEALAQTSVLPLPCVFYAQQRICLETFRVCASDGLTTPLCPTACASYNSQCISSALVPPQFAGNCTAADPYSPSEPLYEDSAQRNSSVTCINSYFFGQLWANSPPACESVLHETMSFIPPGTTQTFFANNISSAVSLLPLVPEAQCREAALRLTCLSVFRPVAADGIVRPLCSSICTNYNTLCIDTNIVPANTRQNCAGLDPFNPSSPNFAPFLSRFGNNITCADSVNFITGNVTCPAPDLFGTDPLSKDPNECKIRCPPPGINNKKQNRMQQNMLRVVLPVSIFCEIWLLAAWIPTYNPTKPTMAMFFVLAIVVQHFGYLLGKWYSFEGWMCIDDFTIRDQSNTGAAVSALFGNFGTIAGITWVSCLLYHLWNSVAMNRYQLFGPNRLIPINPMTAYHIISWGHAALLTLIGFAGDWMDCAAGWNCGPSPTRGSGFVADGLLGVPLTYIFVLNVVLTGLLFYVIISTAGWGGIATQMRLVILCCYYTAVIGYGMYARAIRDDITRDTTAYVQCRISGLSNADCPIGKQVNFPGLMIAEFIAASAGFFLFIISANKSTIMGPITFGKWSRDSLSGRVGSDQANSTTAGGSRHSGSTYSQSTIGRFV